MIITGKGRDQIYYTGEIYKELGNDIITDFDPSFDCFRLGQLTAQEIYLNFSLSITEHGISLKDQGWSITFLGLFNYELATVCDLS